jgi:hypothetical protein
MYWGSSTLQTEDNLQISHSCPARQKTVGQALEFRRQRGDSAREDLNVHAKTGSLRYDPSEVPAQRRFSSPQANLPCTKGSSLPDKPQCSGLTQFFSTEGP